MEFCHELVVPNEDLPCKVFTFEGGDGNYRRDKHWHRSVEIFAVFEGTLTFFINEVKYPLCAGEFMLVNSNEIHSVDSPLPNLTVVAQIPLKAFENYYTGEQFIRFTHDPKAQDDQVMALVYNMYSACIEKKSGYDLKVKAQYYELLYLLVTKYKEVRISRELVRTNRRLSRLSAITAYVKEHYKEELSLERLAEIFGYSPTYLSRMFHKYAGINYSSYLQGIRLEYACQELANSDLTISHIALENGFPNSKAFSKAFRIKYGALPSEYRKIKSPV